MHQPVHTHAVAALQHRPSHVLVTVRVVMPHVKQYSRDAVMDLVYACSSSVEVGQRVLCPPTPRHDRWQKGTVIAVHNDPAAAGYAGRVKYIKPLPRTTRL
ncbi:MAG: hypothetical protein ACTHZ9_12280 [Leucobacter sp.]|uniref:hypothetical protein n=1 Tax=Agrococcus casei TaxID=343512 RepID=UPI003F8D97F0